MQFHVIRFPLRVKGPHVLSDNNLLQIAVVNVPNCEELVPRNPTNSFAKLKFEHPKNQYFSLFPAISSHQLFDSSNKNEKINRVQNQQIEG